MLTLPFHQRVQAATNILIAGCGGGFDLYCGIPFVSGLIDAGKSVTLANLSFTALSRCQGEPLGSSAYRVDRQAAELPYFPELWLSEWLRQRDYELPVYALARTGVQPLLEAYKAIIQEHSIDLVILVDGGTDSLLFGDEPGLGTVEEDAVSILAATLATEGSAILAVLGFGIDHHHGVSHFAFLENTASMIRRGDWLGNISLTTGSAEANAFLDLVTYANLRQPLHQSIVCNSIASAVRGEFGNFHATNRTTGSDLFINPLMTEYWTFAARGITDGMAYADILAGTQTIDEVKRLIETHRDTVKIRSRFSIPL